MPTTKAITKSEITDAAGEVGAVGLYRTLLVPAGEKVEVVIRSGGVELARESWVSAPKPGYNAGVQLRLRTFDDCELDTLKSVAVIGL